MGETLGPLLVFPSSAAILNYFGVAFEEESSMEHRNPSLEAALEAEGASYPGIGSAGVVEEAAVNSSYAAAKTAPLTVGPVCTVADGRPL